MNDIPRPEQLAQDVVERSQQYGLPPIIACIPVLSGVVHHVWELSSLHERFYLKIRSCRFAQLPIASTPRDVRYEAAATTALAQRLPGFFPLVIYCDEDLGILILTDVVGTGKTLESILLRDKISPELFRGLGSTIRTIHEAALPLTCPDRGPEDDFFDRKLAHKIGFACHPALNRVISRLRHNEPRQVIIGDPSPKNIGVNYRSDASSFTFFDLEDSHRGNVVFDVGFVTGHLILHSADATTAAKRVSEFLGGYGRGALDQGLLKAIALAAILYRVDSIVPYCVQLTEPDRRQLCERIRRALWSEDLGSQPWGVLITALLAPHALQCDDSVSKPSRDKAPDA